ncbi:MAG: cytochrome P450 [Solirubrobacterales bacterium]|nr:cytochrome P450 [Solirubrobacterales bacterium]
MALERPPELEYTNPLMLIARDLRLERTSPVGFPPGETDFSLARTLRFSEEPLRILLDCYARFGPVFTLRVFHGNIVFMIGAEANHYITVSHASNFTWRESHFRDLVALVGDGLLTTDGEFHRRSRQIMVPGFHRERVLTYVEAIVEETERALEEWQPGARVELYTWTRRLTINVAMRALFGVDPEGERARSIDAARAFEEALSFYSTPYPTRMLHGPFTPWRKLMRASRKLNNLIYEEIAQRRASGERGEDIMSLLLDAHDEDGEALNNVQIRDQVMTLLWAGHDTTTATVSFMFAELIRHPEIVARLWAEQDAVLGARAPTGEQLMGDALPYLEMVLDETLRKYPAAWLGPRRSVSAFEFDSAWVPGETYVNYSSWATHHLPHLFPEPERFDPERFLPERKAALPKGAYIPFGGGSRMCIGMRFGQLESRVIATLILQRFALELPQRFELRIRQMPTISPRALPVIVHERGRARARPAAVAAA